jgi:hypothetical protein
MAHKINNASTFQTMYMVMIFKIGIEAPGSLVRFNNREESDLGKSYQGSVNGIEGNVWIFLFNNLEDVIRSGMIVSIHDRPVNRCTLRCYFQVVLSTDLKECIKLY